MFLISLELLFNQISHQEGTEAETSASILISSYESTFFDQTNLRLPWEASMCLRHAR